MSPLARYQKCCLGHSLPERPAALWISQVLVYSNWAISGAIIYSVFDFWGAQLSYVSKLTCEVLGTVTLVKRTRVSRRNLGSNTLGREECFSQHDTCCLCTCVAHIAYVRVVSNLVHPEVFKSNLSRRYG